MRKKVIVSLALLLFVTKMYSQNKTLEVIPYYFDEKIINTLCDSLETRDVDAFYIFLSHVDSNIYSYLMWQEKGKNNILRIDDTAISYSTISNIDFLKVKYEDMAILEKESKLKFSPPLIIDLECSYFIFLSRKSKYLITSSNDYCNFVLDNRKRSKREKFINTVRANINLLNNNSKWIFFKKYDRYL